MPVDETRGCIRAFTQLKQQYTELKVILSVGGGGQASEPFARIAADAMSIETFASSARALVDEYGLDGIDSKVSVNFIFSKWPCDISTCQWTDRWLVSSHMFFYLKMLTSGYHS
jgi:hypothetical protein